MVHLNTSLLSWAIRLILGILITGAGIGKLLDMRGFIAVIRTYELGLSTWLLWPIAILVIVFEIVLGLIILSGYHLHTAMLWSIVMHVGYFVLLTTALFRGLALQNCGCFGVFLARPLTWASPIEDLILIGLSYILFILT